MIEYSSSNKFEQINLNIVHFGTEKCLPNHYWGPGIRLNYLIHYVISGKGMFQLNNKTYYLEAGQGFLIPPDVITYYQADKEDPWHYCWVEFSGLNASLYLESANMTLDNPIFTYVIDDFIESYFYQIISLKDYTKSNGISILGFLYLFLAKLIETEETGNIIEVAGDRKKEYVEKAIEFIKTKYSYKIAITDIATFVGLDRSYLCTIFKEYINMSPQEFLVNFRIAKSCEIMESHDISIGDVARSVGYQDPFLFSKMFKKIKGVAPTVYKSEYR